MIPNYDLHLEKREVQKRLFPLVKATQIHTLAGPNLISYINLYPPAVKRINIWENDSEIMMKQLAIMKSIRGRRLSYNFGDIIRAPIVKKAFYDLDFCCYMKSAREHINRFKDCPFMLTTCRRDCSVEETISILLEEVEEKLVMDVPHPHYNLLKTNKNRYIYTTYKDLSPMMTIFKFH